MNSIYLVRNHWLGSLTLLWARLLESWEYDHALRSLRNWNTIEIISVQLVGSNESSVCTIPSADAVGMGHFKLVGRGPNGTGSDAAHGDSILASHHGHRGMALTIEARE